MATSKKPNRPEKRPGSNKGSSSPKPAGGVIFRRYRTVNGKVLDAHDYGYKAWPIKVKR